MSLPSFDKLWTSHPGPKIYPCDQHTFANQCAIRMGVALEIAGIPTSSFDVMYPKRRCYKNFNHNPKHILAAQELANWMKSKEHTFGKVDVSMNVTSANFSNKKGFVFIMNGWGSTDHIDLWDGTKMKAGQHEYFAFGEQVWFWEWT